MASAVRRARGTRCNGEVAHLDDFAARERTRQRRPTSVVGIGGAGEPQRLPRRAGDLEHRIEAAAARVVTQLRDARRSVTAGSTLDRAQRAIEARCEMSRASPSPYSLASAAASSASISCAGIARLARVTETSVIEPASRPTSACARKASSTCATRHGAGLAERRRAEHRHVGDDAGVLDQVADPHQAAGDDRFGAQHRPRRLRLAQRGDRE